ncbi:MAG: adenosylcobinamide-phosphate synthase CbiB [Alphaproteobacteria bacterium]
MQFPWILGAAEPVAPGIVILLALAIDAAIADPRALYRLVPHPVALIGRAVAIADDCLNRPRWGAAARVAAGLLSSVAVVVAATAVGWAVAALARPLPGGWLILAVLASTLIAFRGLYDHVRAVAAGLETDLAAGREAVRHIVGRDPKGLDAAGVARAAIESAAENFSDGVVAPVFWFALFGLPGLAGYKAVNTLDSMIGHRGARYERFGKAAARLDDAVNWLPARLAGGLIAAAALLVPGARAGRALRAMLRDAPQHRSPNAGWSEAAMAGALGLALAGPRRYGDDLVDDAWMGDGRRDLGPADILAALRLYLVAGAALAGLIALTLPI